MIRRYYATKDNTITNAFEENLVTRGTGSNMGASDVLEAFSIYAQASQTSSELARTLIQFDVDKISEDRTSGRIPASGSVNFVMKLYNAPHSQTTPSDFQMTIAAVSKPWEEGYGMDMDFYEDITKDGIGSNWLNASGDNVAEITEFTFNSGTPADYAAGTGENYIKLYNGTTLYNLWFSASVADSAGATGTWIESDITGEATSDGIAAVFQGAVDALDDFSANIIGSTVYVTASTAGASTEQANKVGTLDELDIAFTVDGDNATRWTQEGGDYYTDASSSFTNDFSTGLEDLEVDVTTLVEQWLDSAGNVLGSKDNNGVIVKLSEAYETAARSFFRKKFFGKDTEFFFARPIIEARWDSARKDDRGNFYASSPLADTSDNLNTLYLYNNIRGTLKDIPSLGSNDIYVDLYDSIGGTKLTGSFTGSAVSTGVYSCNVEIETTASTIYDVWFSGSTQYHTGTISVNQFSSQGYSPENTYVLSMPGLRKEYRKNQTHRLNLYARQKDWSPNIYTRAVQSSIPSLVFESSSYQIRRSIDDHIVVPYGTGSTMHTGLSYDVSGNYFDLDTTYLETGYLYEIQYSFYDEVNGWEEQPYRFKFRVVD